MLVCVAEARASPSHPKGSYERHPLRLAARTVEYEGREDPHVSGCDDDASVCVHHQRVGRLCVRVCCGRVHDSVDGKLECMLAVLV